MPAETRAEDALRLGRALHDRLEADTRDDPVRHALWRQLLALQRLEREVVERHEVRRADALERVVNGLRRLGEVGSPAGMLARAAEELGASSDFDRVVVSRVADGAAEVRWVWCRAGREASDAVLGALRGRPVRLAYPVVEAEVVQRLTAAIVSAADGARMAEPIAGLLGRHAYVAAAFVADGRAVGLVQADREPPGRPVDAVDLEALAVFVDGLSQAFERAVLRERVRRHRRQLLRAQEWIDGRVDALSPDAWTDPAPREGGAAAGASGEALLTPREREVLALMARGGTNRAIAEALVVAEGTVKFHVKSILRKLQAANRADAVARHVRLGGPGGAPR